ncbi:MAG: hypothetical protein OXU36_11475 [Candidatus Poribacteria bacterium]|nr:hypothetical protein [Candidatus Poribacteria bacterium]
MNKERVFSDRLNLLDSKLDKILEILTADKQPVAELAADPHPWLTTMLAYEGKDEVDDNAELTTFLGIDPEDTPWCAAMVTSCLKACGKPALGLRARDYVDYGEEGDGSIGNIAVWRSHIGIVCDEEGSIIGGNVSNMVKRSPPAGSEKDWFRNFLGFRKVI